LYLSGNPLAGIFNGYKKASYGSWLS